LVQQFKNNFLTQGGKIMDELDFTPPAQIVHCACCKAQKAARTPIETNSVRIGRRSPKTSQIAAERVLPRTGTKRKVVFDLIQGAGARGLCDHEIESLTGWLHQSASSIRNGLMNDGWITDSGQRRKTPQGNGAIVWVTA
jgi:hypothetical protein